MSVAAPTLDLLSVVSVLEGSSRLLADHNEAIESLRAIQEICSRLAASTEIILVLNGVEPIATKELIATVSGLEDIQIYGLARSVDPDVALLAGLEHAFGGAMLVWDSDAKDISNLTTLLDRIHDGADSAVVSTDQHQNGLRGWAREAFLKAIGETARARETNSRILTKPVLNYVLQHDDACLELRRISSAPGFRHDEILVSNGIGPVRRRTLAANIHHAARLVTAATSIPLRALSLLALISAGAEAIYIAYILIILLIEPNVVRGWTTLSLQTSGGFALLFVILALLAEYVIQLHRQTIKRPDFFISTDYRTPIQRREHQINIVKEVGRALPTAAE